MKRISTHVLDTALGEPAKDVAVRLEKQGASGIWVVLGSSRTDSDGRCGQLLPDSEGFLPGFYRLSFETANYHAAHKVAGLYPVVEITFQVRQGEEQFHIPLLLSPFGYSTYRGS